MARARPPAVPQPGEEARHGGRRSILAHPEDAFPLQIVDQRQVLHDTIMRSYQHRRSHRVVMCHNTLQRHQSPTGSLPSGRSNIVFPGLTIGTKCMQCGTHSRGFSLRDALWLERTGKTPAHARAPLPSSSPQWRRGKGCEEG